MASYYAELNQTPCFILASKMRILKKNSAPWS
jgi:hypothetical protein